MKAPFVFLGTIIAVGTVQVCLGQQSSGGTFSTPAYNGTGAANTTDPRGTSRFGTTGTGATRTNANFGTVPGSTAAGTFGSTNFGATAIGQTAGTIGNQGNGTALVPGATAIPQGDATNTVTPSAPGTSLTTPFGTNSSLGIPNNSVGIGQQSTTAIGQQGTIGIGRQSTTAIGEQGTGTAIMPQTNGFVVNADGSVTGFRAPAGGAAEAGLGGTNSGNAFGTNSFGTNRFRTNQFNTRTNSF
jgi:hypothetical protein